MTDCLDSWAVLRWLEGVEPAASRVEGSLLDRPIMSWINLGEVAYVVERLSGVDRSREVVRELQRLLTLDAPSPRRVLEAARLKANHTMAYADAFALATAIAHDAIVLTGDPELLDSGEDWPVEDLRPR